MTEPAARRPARVLLVNDDPDVLEVVARALELGGHTVARCPDHDAALGAATTTSPDVVVIDLPASGAASLLEAIRTRPEATVRGIRVVSLGTGPANGVRAWAGGADGFLARPFHARELADLVSEVASRPESQRAAHRAAQQAALAD